MSLTIIGFMFTVLLVNILLSLFTRKNSLKAIYCGLVGFSGSSNYNPRILQLLMTLNAIDRGPDATGIYNNLQKVIKKSDHAKKFFPEVSIKKDDVFIGHVRAATVGSKIEKNAHPFMHDTIVLAHNGTLVNHFGLLNSYGLSSANFDVDSDCLAGMLNESMKNCDYNNFDPLEYFKPLTEINGAAAIIFKDLRDLENNRPTRLFVYRNIDRPLCYSHDEYGNMYISSIPEPLKSCDLPYPIEFSTNRVYEIEEGEILAEYELPRFEEAGAVNVKKADKIIAELTGGILSTDYYDLVNNWIQFNLTEEQAKKYKIKGFTKNKFYFVEEIDYETGFADQLLFPTQVFLVNDHNVKVSVPITAFNLQYVNLEFNKYVKFNTTITSRKSTVVVGVKDEVFLVDSVTRIQKTDENVVSIFNTKDNCIYDINFKYITPLTFEEEDEYDAKLLLAKKKSVVKKPTVPAQRKFKSIPKDVELLINAAQCTINDDYRNAVIEKGDQIKTTLDTEDVIEALDDIKAKVDEMVVEVISTIKKHKFKSHINIYNFDDLKSSLKNIYVEMDKKTKELINNN